MAFVDRAFYERQGADAIDAGVRIDCSMQPTTDAVVAMAERYRDQFQTVLDIGCGANLAYDIPIADLGKMVIGVDFTLNFLRMARAEHPRFRLAQADGLRLPFRDASFDAAICSETIEHIEDDCAALAEIARVTKPRGWLFFTVPNLWNASRVIEMARRRDFTVRLMEGHVREYTIRRVKRLLSPHFSIERFYPVGFGWTGPVGGKIDRLIYFGVLRRFSNSIALVARRRAD